MPPRSAPRRQGRHDYPGCVPFASPEGVYGKRVPTRWDGWCSHADAPADLTGAPPQVIGASAARLPRVGGPAGHRLDAAAVGRSSEKAVPVLQAWSAVAESQIVSGCKTANPSRGGDAKLEVSKAR